jgi:glycosyltransferase involved in cell wall biosynthesis
LREVVIIRVIICTQEYPPNYSSGIGNVVFYVAEQLKQRNMDCNVCSPTGPDVKMYNEKLLRILYNHFRPLFFMYKNVYFWYKVRRYVRKNADRYDIIWLHNPLIVPNDIKKCVTTVHTTYYGKKAIVHSHRSHVLFSVLSVIERYFYKKSKNLTFTAIAPPIIKELKEIGVETEILIPNGVDTEKFKPSNNKEVLRKKFGIPEDDLIILSLGKLSEAKQPQKLIEVFSAIEKEMKDVTLVIAGKGELLNKTKEFVEEKKLRNVIFLGYVDEKDAPDLYAGSDYYIMASKYEGQPLTLLEAMASGLSCIVSDIPNLRIVEDANCGVIVNFDDIGKAAEEIIEYLERDNSEHSKNAREYALNNLDWMIISGYYYQLFMQIRGV